MPVPHILAGSASGTTAQLDANFSYFANALAVGSGKVGVWTAAPDVPMHVYGGVVGDTATAPDPVFSVHLTYANGSANNSGSGPMLVLSSGLTGGSLVKSAAIAAPSEDTGGFSRAVGLAFYTSPFDGNRTERGRVDSNGNLIHDAPTSPPALTRNGTMVMNLTSNTNLRISVRGTDGTTRVANITLA
jgi:hypothetical protein